MTYRTTTLAATVVLIVVASAAPTRSGIVNSSHDLRVLQNGGQTNNQVCIFCHTPHRSAE